MAAVGAAARGQSAEGRSGVRAALQGTVRRGDGMLQETDNGWPLYLGQGDHPPGQAEDIGACRVPSLPEKLVSRRHEYWSSAPAGGSA